MIYICYGPKGCGKTRNSDAIRKALNADHVIDDSLRLDTSVEGIVNDARGRYGSTVILTSDPERYVGNDFGFVQYSTLEL